MSDAATAEFLEGGCALIVGTVGPGGEPYATRAWGVNLLAADVSAVRVLLDANDRRSLDDVGGGGRIAITAADVPTLRSVQLKGRCTGVEPGTDQDRARAERYAEAFFADVERTDGTPRHLLERLLPFDFAACTVVVEELYDQTPGPGAGAPIHPPRS